MIQRYSNETYQRKVGDIVYIPLINKIKKEREKQKLNPAKLSKKAGLPSNAIGRIERGDSKQTHPIRAKAIAKALSCNVNDIFEKS